MKSIVNNNNTIKKFPKLMFNKESKLIALMTSNRCGTIVHKGESIFTVGDVCESLTPEKYVDFEGSVMLSND